MSTERAIQQLVLGKGSQFEAPLVDAFLAVLERETELYQRGRLADFSIEAAAAQRAPGRRRRRLRVTTWGAAVA